MNIKRDVFGGKTTHRHDFTVPELEDKRPFNQYKPRIKYPPKPLSKKPHEYKPKDVHTMQYWHKHVPFNILWQPKEIIRTSPYFHFGICPKPEDLQKQEVIKTRPRLYTSPAVSMDDISDPELRKMLCKNMYMSTWQKATEEVNWKLSKREIPTTSFQVADPVKEKYFFFKPIPIEWKKNGRSWETHQLTTLVDPTANYWRNYKHSLNTPTGVDPFLKTVPQETKDEIRELIEKDELRAPYDKLKPYHTGYIPRNVIGPLSKKEIGIKK